MHLCSGNICCGSNVGHSLEGLDASGESVRQCSIVVGAMLCCSWQHQPLHHAQYIVHHGSGFQQSLPEGRGHLCASMSYWSLASPKQGGSSLLWAALRTIDCKQSNNYCVELTEPGSTG